MLSLLFRNQNADPLIRWIGWTSVGGIAPPNLSNCNPGGQAYHSLLVPNDQMDAP